MIYLMLTDVSVFRSVCYKYDMFSEWELLEVLWWNKLILRHIWFFLLLVWVSFGGEINCLTKIHICKADCTKSFEKVALVPVLKQLF